MSARFQFNVALDGLNTLGLKGRAHRFCEITSVAELADLAANGALSEGRNVILGGGSNMVIPGDLDATVLHICIPGREQIGGDTAHLFVRAGAGENWHEFVRWTLQMGWGGLENLSLIPGSVGAAPVQNIGAYGLEVCDLFHSLEAIDLRDGSLVSFDRQACHFDYRNSIFKTAAGACYAITSVTFKLPLRWQPRLSYADLARQLESQGVSEPTPVEVSDAIVAIRQRKLPDPAKLGNAGSFFKNPVVSSEQFAALQQSYPGMPSYPQADGRVKIAAGWLIEQCGWKGKALGPVAMYERQALVLVNLGGATGKDVLNLAAAVEGDVYDRFGVRLEVEPIIL